jgi:D-alanyl-D-alanine carboxypeptidase/D-alanyl-D-alanine-endopeptidase (penicillin-binding protein 4)
MASLLRRRGIRVSLRTSRLAPSRRAAASETLATVTSSPLRRLVRSTNTFSINYYAEMLLKSLAADARGTGTTRHGAAIARAFASQAGGRLFAVNGSGLSRADRASPRTVGALLDRMLESDEEVRAAFLDSLAVAGRTGTLARRMRGTAAHGRCAAKTGTLTGVSALSGYCDTGNGRLIAFSILMTGVSIHRAHLAQDRMAALIARFRP